MRLRSAASAPGPPAAPDSGLWRICAPFPGSSVGIKAAITCRMVRRGSALEALAAWKPEAISELRAQLKKSPLLHFVLTNVETNIASADKDIMRHYAALVRNPQPRESILDLIITGVRRRPIDDVRGLRRQPGGAPSSHAENPPSARPSACACFTCSKSSSARSGIPGREGASCHRNEETPSRSPPLDQRHRQRLANDRVRNRAASARPRKAGLAISLWATHGPLLDLLQNAVQHFLRELVFGEPAHLVHRHVVQEGFDRHVGFLFGRDFFGRSR